MWLWGHFFYNFFVLFWVLVWGNKFNTEDILKNIPLYVINSIINLLGHYIYGNVLYIIGCIYVLYLKSDFK